MPLNTKKMNVWDARIKNIVPCDSSKVCTKKGCLNCISNDECIICNQGNYLLGGECKKYINGCSLCAYNETCQYCFSGCCLNNENKCIFDIKQLDFNINLYHKKKFN